MRLSFLYASSGIQLAPPLEKLRSLATAMLRLLMPSLTETVTVEFEEGKIVEYEFSDMEEIELAYAITIHKSQGSEYPAVILPLLSGPRMLMNRNLLYTGVTRAKKCVTIVGDENCFAQMIQNNCEQKRYSGLVDRLKEN